MANTSLTADPNYRYSINKFTGDGERTMWDINFAGGFISRNHVKARITDIHGIDTAVEIIWLSDATIQITPAVPYGAILTVWRETPKGAPIADFHDGAVVNEKNLDDNARQAVFIAAEAIDRGEGALTDFGPRAILVPVGQTAPGLDINQFKGKLVGVGLDGNFSPIRLNGRNGEVGVDTDMVDYNGQSLFTVLTDRFNDLELTAQELQNLTETVTAQGEAAIEQATSTDTLNTALTNLRNDHEALGATVDALAALTDGETDGLYTLVVNEQSSRIAGDDALAATIAIIGAKSGDGSAFILDLDNIKVSPTESLAERLEFIEAEQEDAAALIQQEQEARVAADLAEASQRESLGATLNDNIAAAVAAEASARATAIGAEASQRTTLAATLRAERDAAIVNEATNRNDAITAAVATEAAARVAGDAAEASARTSLAATLRGETTAAVASEASARSTAISAEATARELLGTTLGSAITAQVLTETNARVAADNVFTQNFTFMGARNAGGTAFILNESSLLLTGGSSLGSRLTGIDTAIGNVNTRVANEETARATAVAGVASRSTALEATVNSPTTGVGALNTGLLNLNNWISDVSDFANNINVGVNARIDTEESARASADSALATRATNLEATVNHGTTGVAATYARVVAEETARASADTALANRATALEATVNNGTTGVGALNARIAAEETARATAISAEATARQTLAAQLITSTSIKALTSKFANGPYDWQYHFEGLHTNYPLEAYTGDTSVNMSFPVYADMGKVFRRTCRSFDGYADVANSGYLKTRADGRYRMRAKMRWISGSAASAGLEAYLIGLNGSLGMAGAWVTPAAMTVGGPWVEATCEVTLDVSTVGTTPFIRGMARFQPASTHGDCVYEVAYVECEDITDIYVTQALVTTEQNARITAVSAEATARQTLSASIDAAAYPQDRGFRVNAVQAIKQFTTGFYSPFTAGSMGDLSPGFGAVYAVSGVGKVLRFDYGWLISNQFLKLTPGATYRAQARYRKIAGSPPGAVHVGVAVFDDTGALLWNYYTYAVAYPTGTPFATIGGNVTYDQIKAAYPTGAYIRFVLLGGDGGTGVVNELEWASLEDITDYVTANASITTEASVRATAVGNLEAKYGLTLDVNGYITGWATNNNGSTGTMTFRTDKFSIIKPSTTGPGQPMFEVDGVDGLIKLGLPIKNNGVTTQAIDDGAMGEAAMAFDETGVTSSSTSVWSTIHTIGITPKSGKPVKVDFTMFAKGTSDSTRIKLRVVRADGTAVYGGSAGVEMRINNEGVPICIRLVSGSVANTAQTYTLQAQKSVNTEVVTFSQRIAYAEELSRVNIQSFSVTAPSGGGPTGGGGGGGGGYVGGNIP